MSHILSGLNPPQQKAVTTTEGYIRVLAGPGTGKTRVLAYRYAYLINDVGISPDSIMCITFTNKAANEMRLRIRRLVGDNCGSYISTFHGFCVRLLHEDSHVIQYPQNFVVLDNSDVKGILGEIYQERNLSLREMTYKDAIRTINDYKHIVVPDYYKYILDMSLDTLKLKYSEATGISDIIFYGYLYYEKKMFGLDFNDLLIFTLHILQTNENIRIKWQKRLEYIMVDECQDTNEKEENLVSILSTYHQNLFVVGDPDQMIYSWRGSCGHLFLEFDKLYPNSKDIFVLNNYRSTPQILNVANSLISNNKNRIKKEIVPTKPSGLVALYNHASTSWEEAEWIVTQITNLHESGVPYKDCAILYRAHYLTGIVEQILLQKKIPYKIYSGIQFYERKEIKDVHSYLRMIVYQDDLSFLRIVNEPKRNIGKKKISFLKEYATTNACTLYDALKQNFDSTLFRSSSAKVFIDLIEEYKDTYDQYSITELLSNILDKSGYEELLRTDGDLDRLDNVAQLKQMIYETETNFGEDYTLDDYLSQVALLTNSDLEDRGDKVKLMTIHAAKGLEFPYVFVCGLSEGIFPSRRVKTMDQMEEERRLAFVAITRAEKRLFLSDSEGTNLDGSYRYPSRFIFDIKEEYLSYVTNLDDEFIFQALVAIDDFTAKIENRKDSIYAVGDQVQHHVFGKGKIIEIDTEENRYKILFDEMDTPRSISFNTQLSRCIE